MLGCQSRPLYIHVILTMMRMQVRCASPLALVTPPCLSSWIDHPAPGPGAGPVPVSVPVSVPVPAPRSSSLFITPRGPRSTHIQYSCLPRKQKSRLGSSKPSHT